MPRTFSQDFERDDETEVTVDYTISGGCAAHYGSFNYPGHPGEPPEVEIVKAYTDAGPVVLTQTEDERFCQWIIENHEDEGDDPADYADFDERNFA